MDRQLIELLADGRFHSGEELGRLLGISRAAVWKRLRKLEPLGLSCEAVPGKGYRLAGGLELLSAARIREALEPPEAVPVQVVERTGSTNADLLERLQGGEEPPRALLAEFQHNGRGRRGRPWVSPYGRSLYLSLAWPFAGGATQLEGLSLAVGTVLAECLQRRGLGDRVGLKWPNDVLVGGRKLAGILIELAGEMDERCVAVIGIGVNGDMGSTPGESIDQAWTDLRRELGYPLDRSLFAAELLSALAVMLPGFSRAGFASLRERWQRFDLCSGREVAVQVGEHTHRGVAEGVTASGALAVTVDGQRELFHGGEVSLRLSAGDTGGVA